MPLLKIQSWYGRLGNNITQLRNAIQIGLYLNCSVTFPTHPFFNTSLIQPQRLNDEKNDGGTVHIDNEGEFFYRDKLEKVFGQTCFVSNIDETIRILRSIFIIDSSKIQTLNNDDLVIHIRSGDNHVRPHPNYIPPPLSYYVGIIESSAYKNIFLLSEDTKNPIIPKLIELYPRIQFTINDLKTDVTRILSAQNIVTSVGTFIPCLLYLSSNIRHVFYPSFCWAVAATIDHLPEIKFHQQNYDTFKAKCGPWQDNPEQRHLLLTM